MRYDEFAYLWPPRPEIAVDPTLLHTFQRQGYIAQAKLNGTCSVIAVAPDKSIIAMNRHNEVHKAWTPTPEVMRAFTDLPGTGWYVFVAELLHNKVAGLREVNYVNDILVNDGEYLVGATQEERQDILHDRLMTDDATETMTHFVVNPNLWLPVEYDEGFATLFANLKGEEQEGLVLKNPKQKLSLCTRQKSNTVGQIKCRRTRKAYSF
jgi:hypothetical protein